MSKAIVLLILVLLQFLLLYGNINAVSFKVMEKKYYVGDDIGLNCYVARIHNNADNTSVVIGILDKWISGWRYVWIYREQLPIKICNVNITNITSKYIVVEYIAVPEEFKLVFPLSFVQIFFMVAIVTRIRDSDEITALKVLILIFSSINFILPLASAIYASPHIGD